MMRYALYFCVLLLCIGIEFGLLHALPMPWPLVPFGLAVGVYFVFTLRPDLGLLWFVGTGFASDVHAMYPVGETLIGALIGGLLIYVVQQHISHSSLYAVMILGAGSAAAWSITVLFIRGVMGVSPGSIGVVVPSSIAAAVLAGGFLLMIPWLKRRFYSSIRLQL